MKGGKNRQPLGYTIIEVMIVLAVSGLMFLIAAEFINGKQERTSFTSGVSGMASQVQDTLQQVTSGQYSDVPLNCQYTGGVVSFSPLAPTAQGTNGTCIFLGKLLRFSHDSSKYKVISLAAGQTGGTVTPTLSNIYPVTIAALTSLQATPQSLLVTGMAVTDAVSGTIYNNTYYDFGFAQGLGTSFGGSFLSGAQTVSMIYSPVTQLQSDSAIDNNVKYAKAITICLSDGTQHTKLVLGGSSSNQLMVDTVYLNPGAPCP